MVSVKLLISGLKTTIMYSVSVTSIIIVLFECMKDYTNSIACNGPKIVFGGLALFVLQVYR